jgi:hypothetical protein
MPTTFELADELVADLLARVMAEHHPDLAEAGVKVVALFADNPKGPAIRHGGYAVLAQVRVVALKDRVTKRHDAEVLIDRRAWDELRPGQRAATLDHELSHLKLRHFWRAPVLDGRGQPTGHTQPKWDTDDLGRPALKTVPGDWSAGDGFAAVVARHGLDSVEYRNLETCRRHAEDARAAGEVVRRVLAGGPPDEGHAADPRDL